MSSSLLQKSLKLFEDCDKPVKSGVYKNLQKHSKKKKQILIDSKKKEELIKKNVENNLKAIERLNHYSVSKQVSQQIIQHVIKSDIPLEDHKIEEKTVFTEEDFAAFEREYEID